MPADNYIINNDETKVKQFVLQIKSNNEKKHFQEIQTEKGKQTVEVIDAPNAVIPELRIGAHGALHEDFIRHAILCYNEHNNHNMQRRVKTIERIDWWNKLPEAEQKRILAKRPDFAKKLRVEPIVDSWSDHCLAMAGITTNMSVSSTMNGNKPLVHRYLEPHTKTETIERMKHLPEDDQKKPGLLGGIF